jgi:hypothetical protein
MAIVGDMKDREEELKSGVEVLQQDFNAYV